MPNAVEVSQDDRSSSNDRFQRDYVKEYLERMIAWHENPALRDSISKNNCDFDHFDPLHFGFFMLGGAGQCYTAEHVKLMRRLPTSCFGPNSFVNKHRDTPLHLGIIHEDWDFVIFLLELGADPSERRHSCYGKEWRVNMGYADYAEAGNPNHPRNLYDTCNSWELARDYHPAGLELLRRHSRFPCPFDQ